MMSNEFIYTSLGWDKSTYAYGDLLNLLIHLISILAHGYLLVISLWSFLWGLTLIFTSLSMMVVYNCLNTCLYTLWSTLILISCIVSHSSLGLCLMSSLPMEESYVHKVDWTLANRVVERKKHDKWLSKGRACIEFVRENLIQGELFDSERVFEFDFSWSFCFGFEFFQSLL
jgi:hypothetical protein